MEGERHKACPGFDPLPSDEPGGWRTHLHDKGVIHALVEFRHDMRRHVDELPDGIRSRTLCSNPEVVALLHDHIQAMARRLAEGTGLRAWDPLYEALFGDGQQVQLRYELLPDGLSAEVRAQDPRLVRMIQAHAQAVSSYLADGYGALQRAHLVPTSDPSCPGGH